MRILHLCLGCWYIEGFNYQENELPKQNKLDGHDVQIIASTEVLSPNGTMEYVEPCDYMNPDGIRVIRLPYKKVLFRRFYVKFRAYKGLYKQIIQFRPDVIFYHGFSSFDIMTAAKYKREHPFIKLFCDSHADFSNSATNVISRDLLHKFLYRSFLACSMKQIDKIFYITIETKNFLEKIYKLRDAGKMMYLPLGGILISPSIQLKLRSDVCRELCIDGNNSMLLIHSGKLSKLKKTVELLSAFHSVQNEHIKLLVVGTLSDDIKEKALRLINKDNRIYYLGWQKSQDLIRYLSASDLYLQPGDQTNTLQCAICCGCAVAAFPYPSHTFLLGDSFFKLNDYDDIRALISNICFNRNMVVEMKKKDWQIAVKKLDYRVIASTIYSISKN